MTAIKKLTRNQKIGFKGNETVVEEFFQTALSNQHSPNNGNESQSLEESNFDALRQPDIELSEENKKLFAVLHQFIWIQGEPLPLIFDVNAKVYADQGITEYALKQLEADGLLNFEPDGYVKKKFGKHTRLFYCGSPTKIGFPNGMNNQLDLGCVILTEKGKMLVSVQDMSRNQVFYEYVIRRWYESGYLVSSIQVDQKTPGRV